MLGRILWEDEDSLVAAGLPFSYGLEIWAQIYRPGVWKEKGYNSSKPLFWWNKSDLLNQSDPEVPRGHSGNRSFHPGRPVGSIWVDSCLESKPIWSQELPLHSKQPNPAQSPEIYNQFVNFPARPINSYILKKLQHGASSLSLSYRLTFPHKGYQLAWSK